MLDTHIENLATLLQNGKVTKEEVLERINQIKFKTVDNSTKNEQVVNDLLLKDLDQNVNYKKLSVNEVVVEKSKDVEYETSNNLPDNFTTAVLNSVEEDNSCQARNSKFINRILIYQKQKEKQLQKSRAVIEEQEMKECSFRPKVNKVIGTPKENVVKRLYEDNTKQEIIEKLRLEKKQREETSIKESCTFHPVIVSKEAKPRYMENNNIKSLKSLSVQDKLNFHPEVKLPSGIKEKISEYLNVDPYTRLSNIPKKIPNTETVVQNKMKTTGSQKNLMKGFFERQEKFVKKKESNKKKLLDTLKLHTKPPLNKKSKEILMSAKERRTSKSKERPKKDLPLQPHILPKSRRKKNKQLDDLVYLPIKEKNTKINELKKQLEKEESKKYTFQPTLNKNEYTNIDTEFHMYDNIDACLNYYAILKRRHEINNEITKQIQEEIEMTECTHRPKINRSFDCSRINLK